MQFDESGYRIPPIEIQKSKEIYLRSPMGVKSEFCKNVCKNYHISKYNFRRTKLKCNICQTTIGIEGTKNREGRFCTCCGCQLGRTLEEVEKSGKFGVGAYDARLSNEEIRSVSEKKSTPIYEESDSSKKTYYELKDFIEEGMKLQANYQLVMLDQLISFDVLHKGEIAEALAYWNNKDPSDYDTVKYFLNTVPVYNVLIDRGFVVETSNDSGPKDWVKSSGKWVQRLPSYELNVELDEMQQTRIQEMITERLEQYNQEHNIPDNEFEHADSRGNIDWWAVKRSIKSQVEQEIRPQTVSGQRERQCWIWSVTEENWDKVIEKNVWGSKAYPEKIGNYVKKGDHIIFYVKGTNQFKAIMELSSEWQDDSTNMRWTDEIEGEEIIYNSFVELKKVVLGFADIALLENLEIFKNTIKNKGLVLKGTGGGYPANNCHPIPDSDYEQIKQMLEENADTVTSVDEWKQLVAEKGINHSHPAANLEDQRFNQVRNYVLLRHKADRNPYRDDPDGSYYHYPAIANYTKIKPGTRAIWFDRIDGEYYFWGYGKVSEVIRHVDDTKRGGIAYEAKFDDFIFFSESSDSLEVNGKFLKKATQVVKTDIRQSRSYNDQSSILPISEVTYDSIIKSRTWYKKKLSKKEIMEQILEISKNMRDMQERLDKLTKRLEDKDES